MLSSSLRRLDSLDAAEGCGIALNLVPEHMHGEIGKRVWLPVTPRRACRMGRRGRSCGLRLKFVVQASKPTAQLVRIR